MKAAVVSRVVRLNNFGLWALALLCLNAACFRTLDPGKVKCTTTCPDGFTCLKDPSKAYGTCVQGRADGGVDVAGASGQGGKGGGGEGGAVDGFGGFASDGSSTNGDGDAPQALTNGSSCATDNDCASTHCADGVCCDKACGGCNACLSDLTGKDDGVCTFVASGKDPHDTCQDETVSNQCGNDGTCDGQGACRKVGANHVCTKGSCSADGKMFTPATTCDGNGACTTAGAEDCGGFQCAAEAGCLKACTTSADCGKSAYCNSTTKTCAAQKPNGQAAADASECSSGVLADGVCCDKACAGCSACTAALNGQAANTTGQCLPVQAGGNDPHKTCTVAPPCGLDGKCDGTGACRYTPLATSCAADSCAGSTLTTSACDGSHKCTASTSACPNSAACASATACKTGCTIDTDCASANFYCASGTCKPKGAGVCSSGTECVTGNCVDGHCCDSLCQGNCESCVTGTCSFTLTPRKACAGSGTCVGVCDKSNTKTCTFDNTTICAAQSCSGGVRKNKSICDGQGNCPTQTTTTCDPNQCKSDGSDCATCTDEPLATTCAGGHCGPTTNNCGHTVQCSTTCSGTGQTCGGGGTAGICGCTSASKTQTCGNHCGSATDNCGQSVDCGGCTSPETCGGGGTSSVCGCTPNCSGKCGGSNGCGGTCPNNCVSPQTCGGGGTTNVCGCTANCSGKCGGSDGCGGTCPNNCVSPQTCGGGGTANVCGCSPNCSGKCSGSDGCGGTCPNNCASPQTCGGNGTANVCGCAPNCSGKCSGSDGCGGTCPNNCVSPQTCGGNGTANVCGCATNCSGKCGGGDGCGGTCPNNCVSPQSCGGGGTANVCGCSASCNGVCGGSNGCGGTCPNNCVSPQSCGGGGPTNVCGCTANCNGKCGGSNGCGGTCPNNCVSPQSCGGGGTTNVCGCTASCSGKCSGSNGCGGTCPNNCSGGQQCNSNGQCVCPQKSPNNLLNNPGFDGSLASWTAAPTPNGTASYNKLDDADGCTSGSGSVSIVGDADVFQCININSASTYSFGVMYKGVLFCQVQYYNTFGCNGAAGFASGPMLVDTSGTATGWTALSIGGNTPPAGTESMSVDCSGVVGNGEVDKLYVNTVSNNF